MAVVASKKAARKARSRPALVFFASTEQSADVLYLGKVRVPDSFLCLVHEGEKIAIVSPLEIGRMQKSSAFDTVLALTEYQEKARQQLAVRRPSPADILRVFAKERGLRYLQVPYDFPAGLALQLEQAGFTIEPVEGAILPEREKKSREEANEIRKANAACSAGFRAVEDLLRRAEVKGRRLVLDRRTLTSERVKEAIAIACLQKGAVASEIIVAGGDQGCDPHESGQGPLRPNELIVVDIFPRRIASGYHGDMTRTYLKGKASAEQKNLVATVQQAQAEALQVLKAGVSAPKVHQAAAGCLSRAGYRTEIRNGTHIGFFHGTGHGLGLEVHEPPRVSPYGSRLKVGAVVTIEPGLYYPGLGGCRIEDVAWLTRDGYELLSRHGYRWQIR